MGAQAVMRKSLRQSLAWLVAAAVLPVATLAATIDELAWLSGCWAAVDQDVGSTEQWMPPAGGTMLGVSRSVRDGKTLAFEFLRIVEQDDGELVFIASPSGQNTTSFSMTSFNVREVIFENPDHDFPQRIIYRLISDEDLLGRIEGTIDGAERAVDFPMKKIDCESGRGFT